jgi:capsular polysaccharide biosynthesis protein
MQPRQRSWTGRLVTLAVVGGLIGAALGWLTSTLTVPGYDASAFLLVTPAGQAPLSTGEVQYAQAISQVVANPNVLAAAGTGSDLPDDPRNLRANPSPNAPLIEITVNAATAGQAQRQAQAVAEAVVAYTEQRDDVLGVHAVLLAPATDGEPAGLSLAAYLVVGAVMGMALGVVAALLRGDRSATVPRALPERTEQTAADGRAPATTVPSP